MNDTDTQDIQIEAALDFLCAEIVRLSYARDSAADRTKSALDRGNYGDAAFEAKDASELHTMICCKRREAHYFREISERMK